MSTSEKPVVDGNAIERARVFLWKVLGQKPPTTQVGELARMLAPCRSEETHAHRREASEVVAESSASMHTPEPSHDEPTPGWSPGMVVPDLRREVVRVDDPRPPEASPDGQLADHALLAKIFDFYVGQGAGNDKEEAEAKALFGRLLPVVRSWTGNPCAHRWTKNGQCLKCNTFTTPCTGTASAEEPTPSACCLDSSMRKHCPAHGHGVSPLRHQLSGMPCPANAVPPAACSSCHVRAPEVCLGCIVDVQQAQRSAKAAPDAIPAFGELPIEEQKRWYEQAGLSWPGDRAEPVHGSAPEALLPSVDYLDEKGRDYFKTLGRLPSQGDIAVLTELLRNERLLGVRDGVRLGLEERARLVDDQQNQTETAAEKIKALRKVAEATRASLRIWERATCEYEAVTSALAEYDALSAAPPSSAKAEQPTLQAVLNRASEEVAAWPAWRRSPDVEAERKHLGINTEPFRGGNRIEDSELFQQIISRYTSFGAIEHFVRRDLLRVVEWAREDVQHRETAPCCDPLSSAPCACREAGARQAIEACAQIALDVRLADRFQDEATEIGRRICRLKHAVVDEERLAKDEVKR